MQQDKLSIKAALSILIVGLSLFTFAIALVESQPSAYTEIPYSSHSYSDFVPSDIAVSSIDIPDSQNVLANAYYPPKVQIKALQKSTPKIAPRRERRERIHVPQAARANTSVSENPRTVPQHVSLGALDSDGMLAALNYRIGSHRVRDVSIHTTNPGSYSTPHSLLRNREQK